MMPSSAGAEHPSTSMAPCHRQWVLEESDPPLLQQQQQQHCFADAATVQQQPMILEPSSCSSAATKVLSSRRHCRSMSSTWRRRRTPKALQQRRIWRRRGTAAAPAATAATTGNCYSRSSSRSKLPPLPFLLGAVAFLLLLLVGHQQKGALAVRCYCTDEHCVPYGVCEAAVCLVGLVRANNAVIRTCGNEPLGCRRNMDRWSHICSCGENGENFCNTFLFLKASTNIDGGVPGSRPSAALGNRPHPQQHQAEAPGDDDDHRIFERVDPPSGDFATFDHPSDEETRTIKNSNLLTLLLVIVPLSVGAAAVVVVAINYYCHLC